MTTTDVDNWPADAMGVQGPELMERFQKHAERFETEIVFDHIHKVAIWKRTRSRLTGDQGTYTCDALIIATGASAKYLGLPSEAKLHGPGRVGLRDLRRLLLQGSRKSRSSAAAIPRSRKRSTCPTLRST